ncbi:YdeI/OmpD-associated family protein [Microbacterium sp. NPDC057407]|uniref:YdeI/OmpD-associated family protein n=1 Tax=Microbacterium sp. NPDC057407 TaxID=3346120 RepID=UPI0036721F8B
MSEEWPNLGPAHEIDGFVEPMLWGTSTYAIIRMPTALVAAAQAAGTRRVGGTLDEVEVNLALTRAPVIDDTFVWSGASLLRRMRLEPGDPVRGWLAPVDPDFVLVPSDVAAAFDAAGARDAWEGLPPAKRRQRLVPVESAATAATRARRIDALVSALG